jgi:hypothetical protein
MTEDYGQKVHICIFFTLYVLYKNIESFHPNEYITYEVYGVSISHTYTMYNLSVSKHTVISVLEECCLLGSYAVWLL